MLNLDLIPNAIPELFAQVTQSGEIALADRYGMMAAISSDRLTEEEQAAIDRLIHAVRRGRLHLANKLSTIIQ